MSQTGENIFSCSFLFILLCLTVTALRNRLRVNAILTPSDFERLGLNVLPYCTIKEKLSTKPGVSKLFSGRPQRQLLGVQYDPRSMYNQGEKKVAKMSF